MAFTKAFKALACMTLASGALAAAPASANGDENAMTSQATAPISGAITGVIPAESAAVSLDSGEYRSLFGEWRERDNHMRADGQAPRETVSIPTGMPVEGVRMSSGYGMRNHPVLRKRKAHNGVDLAGARGTPVYATADGTVDMAQYYSSYGNYVQIDHGGDLETRYAHLSSYTVAPGERVEKGQLIGYIGSTGRSTGPHLHYEIRVAGVAVDPTPYMVGPQFALTEGEGGVGGD